MKFISNFSLAILFIFSIVSASSQDLIYTVSGEIDNEKTALDSILFENLSNGTRLLFENLPEQHDYIINLTTRENLGATGVQNYFADEVFKLVTNVPGRTDINCSKSVSGQVFLNIYNIQGQMVYSTSHSNLNTGSRIKIYLETEGMYIIEISSSLGKVSFKGLGAARNGKIEAIVGDQAIRASGGIKSSLRKHFTDFSFAKGDSLRVSVYLDSYYSRPKELVINNSESVDFDLQLSAVESFGISDAFVDIDADSSISLEYDAENGKVRLKPSNDSLSLNVGDVITIDADTTGYLRKITAITEENDSLILETEQAYMNDLFVDISLKLNTALMEATVGNKGALTANELSKILTDENGFIHPVEIIYYDRLGNSFRKSVLDDEPVDSRVSIIDYYEDFGGTDIYGTDGDDIHFYIEEGHVSLVSDAVFEFEFDYEGELTEDTKIKRGDIKSFKFYLDAEADFSTLLALDMYYSYEAEDTEELIDFNKATAHFVVPPGVPVWITFDCDIFGHYNMNVDASLEADWGFESSHSLQVGGVYERAGNTFTPIKEYESENTIFPLNVDGEVNAFARLELYPRVEVKFYSFFGPYAEIVPFVEGNYNAALHSQVTFEGEETFMAWNSGIDLGLDLRVGTILTFLGRSLEFGPAVINCFDEPLWSSPHLLEPLVAIPGEAEVGSTMDLRYRVTDLLGNPVTLCPVYIAGDGSFNKQIAFTDIYGEIDLIWALLEEGENNIDLTIYNADGTVIHQIMGSTIAVLPDVPSGSVQINTTPPGASVYLNGSNMSLTTPAVIENITPNTPQHIRLYLEGYNEYNESFEIEEDEIHIINTLLQTPEPPLPVFTIYSPTEGTVFNWNVITVSGLIELEDTQGYRYDFTGNSAILTLNGIDRQIAVSDGAFNEALAIVNGENILQFRANSADGETGYSDLIKVFGEFEVGDYEVTLTWNTPTSDMDLHVWAPNGDHCYYFNMITANGSLDIDDIEGFGPETFTFSDNPQEGKYYVQVNSYDLDRDAYTDVNVQISGSDGTMQNFGPHRFTSFDMNGYYEYNPNSWWDVLELTISSSKGGVSAIENAELLPFSSLPDWLKVKMVEDMKAHPLKSYLK